MGEGATPASRADREGALRANVSRLSDDADDPQVVASALSSQAPPRWFEALQGVAGDDVAPNSRLPQCAAVVQMHLALSALLPPARQCPRLAAVDEQ